MCGESATDTSHGVCAQEIHEKYVYAIHEMSVFELYCESNHQNFYNDYSASDSTESLTTMIRSMCKISKYKIFDNNKAFILSLIDTGVLSKKMMKVKWPNALSAFGDIFKRKNINIIMKHITKGLTPEHAIIIDSATASALNSKNPSAQTSKMPSPYTSPRESLSDDLSEEDKNAIKKALMITTPVKQEKGAPIVKPPPDPPTQPTGSAETAPPALPTTAPEIIHAIGQAVKSIEDFVFVVLIQASTQKFSVLNSADEDNRPAYVTSLEAFVRDEPGFAAWYEFISGKAHEPEPLPDWMHEKDNWVNALNLWYHFETLPAERKEVDPRGFASNYEDDGAPAPHSMHCADTKTAKRSGVDDMRMMVSAESARAACGARGFACVCVCARVCACVCVCACACACACACVCACVCMYVFVCVCMCCVLVRLCVCI